MSFAFFRAQPRKKAPFVPQLPPQAVNFLLLESVAKGQMFKRKSKGSKYLQDDSRINELDLKSVDADMYKDANGMDNRKVDESFTKQSDTSSAPKSSTDPISDSLSDVPGKGNTSMSLMDDILSSLSISTHSFAVDLGDSFSHINQKESQNAKASVSTTASISDASNSNTIKVFQLSNDKVSTSSSLPVKSSSSSSSSSIPSIPLQTSSKV